MSEISSDEISVEEVMERIKEKIIPNKDGAYAQKNRQQYTFKLKVNESKPIQASTKETELWHFVKKVQYKLQKYPCYGFVYKLAVRLKYAIPKYRKSISIHELVKCQDEEFINNVYRVILRREPDEEGYRHFLTKLRLGRSSKSEIIGNLRYSQEGKQKGVRIKGLPVRYIINSIYRIPAIGYIAKLSAAIIRFPKLLKNIQGYEAFTNARFTQYSQRLNEVSANLEMRIEQISNELSSKADAVVVDGIKNELSSKADAVVVDGIKNELSSKADAQIVVGIKDTLTGILRQTRDQKMHILDQHRRLTLLLEEARKRLPEPISQEQIKNMVKEDDHMLDAMYVAFEDQFRGTREDIKGRLEVYLPYLEKIKVIIGDAQILDVGCGRGEWLELIKEHGYTARGLDLNRVMVQQCNELGLEVVESDVIEYLRKQKPNSVGIITGIHIIEHLPLKTLIALFDESLRVLKPGGMVIFETPNPENLIVSAFTFYYDPTHKNPLPPGTTQFLLEQRGFVNTEIVKLHKYSDFVEVKDNEEFRNKWFYSEMDYAILAYKS